MKNPHRKNSRRSSNSSRSIKRIIERLDALLRAGQMASNVCYNLAQRDYIPGCDARSMTLSYKAWDEASRAVRELMPPK